MGGLNQTFHEIADKAGTAALHMRGVVKELALCGGVSVGIGASILTKPFADPIIGIGAAAVARMRDINYHPNSYLDRVSERPLSTAFIGATSFYGISSNLDSFSSNGYSSYPEAARSLGLVSDDERPKHLSSGQCNAAKVIGGTVGFLGSVTVGGSITAWNAAAGTVAAVPALLYEAINANLSNKVYPVRPRPSIFNPQHTVVDEGRSDVPINKSSNNKAAQMTMEPK